MSKIANPYDVVLIQSGNPNLLYAPSSDGYSVYAVMFNSETEVTCTCVACEQFHLDCRHRASAQFRFQYVPELDQPIDDITWKRIKNRIQAIEEEEAYQDLFGGGDAA